MQIPNWLSEIVKKFKCPLCDSKMRDMDITSFGWRINERDPQKDFFVDYFCGSCDKKIFIPLSSIDLEKFAMQVLDEIMEDELDDVEENEMDEKEDIRDIREIDTNIRDYKENNLSYDSGKPEPYKRANPNLPKAKKRLSKSKIKDDEVDNFINYINNCEDYNDLLKNIGLTENDIKECNKNTEKK